jgi:transcriptional regulator with XRE-family HTH domain
MMYQIQVDDIPLFVQLIRNIQQYDYNVKEVVSEFSNLKLLKDKQRALGISVKELEDKAGILRSEYSMLEQLVTSNNQKLSLYYELEAMGLGLKELKLLWHTVREIAEANNIPPDQASQKFYKEIEEQYDDKLGLELKINELRSEISTVSINLNALRKGLLAQPLVASSLQRLFSKGVVEQDIVELANLFDRSSNDGADKSNIDRQSLLTELQKYGSIKSTIQELTQQVDRLRNEISALQKQKQQV